MPMAEKLAETMVLPERIELSTSPLPRGCSTTELRQRGAGASGQGIHEALALGNRLTALRRSPSIAAMAETPRLTPTRRDEHAARRERLARALRDNLRRRKEQGRAREPHKADRVAGADSGGEPPA